MASLSKTFDFNLRRDHQKNFLWASRLWVSRRKEPILGYFPKNDEKKNSGGKGLRQQQNKHRDIADNLPGLHALTGCDSTSYICNRENICSEGTHSWKIFEIVGWSWCWQSWHAGRSKLHLLWHQVLVQNVAETFQSHDTMSGPRKWQSQNYQMIFFKLKSPPPTSHAITEHSKRAHH